MMKIILAHQIFLVFIFLCFNLSHCFIPTTTRTAAGTRTMSLLLPTRIHPLAYYAQDRHILSNALSLSKDDMDRKPNEDMIDEEQKKLQIEIDSMVMNPQSTTQPNSNALFGGGFDADAFDETKLPLPLFSTMVIFVITTYLTGYMFYIGIMGFPENEIVPCIF